MNYIFWIIISVFILRIIRFFSTPLLKKIGFYKYYSSKFFIMPLSKNKFEIHLGTSWDFFNSQKFSARHQFNLLAEGMLKLCKDIESNKINKQTKFKGYTTYFNDSTIRRFGFRYRSFNIIEMILFAISYAELCVLKSLALKKITFIPLNKLKVVTINASELIKFKAKYNEFLLHSGYAAIAQQRNNIKPAHLPSSVQDDMTY